MDADDFDAALYRLDEMLFGGEPPEPDWSARCDSLAPGAFCPTCHPSPRERRRLRHREWQRRDREAAAALRRAVADVLSPGLGVDLPGRRSPHRPAGPLAGQRPGP